MEEFKPPDNVVWEARDVELFQNWDFISRPLWQLEAIERIQRRREVGAGDERTKKAVGACCSLQ